MKKKVIAVFMTMVILMILPATVVAAQNATTYTINLTLNGKYDTKDYRFQSPSYITANVTIGGELKEKNGNWYLSPLTGNIKIGESNYEIMVKPFNYPQPIQYHLFYDTPEQKSEQWYCMVEVNIEGDKYTGWLWFWLYNYYSSYNGQSQLWFQGIVDGKIATFNPVAPWVMPDIQ